jgi:hypothetical protein
LLSGLGTRAPALHSRINLHVESGVGPAFLIGRLKVKGHSAAHTGGPINLLAVLGIVETDLKVVPHTLSYRLLNLLPSGFATGLSTRFAGNAVG